MSSVLKKTKTPAFPLRGGKTTLSPIIASTSDETDSASPTTSDPVLERFLGEKLQALKHEIVAGVVAELHRPLRGASLNPRKQFIAGIIKKIRDSPRKMSVSEILREADRYQELFPKKAHYRPPPAWKVRFWADMKSENRAQAWIAKIKADPRYLPFDYLTPRGKKRSTTNHE